MRKTFQGLYRSLQEALAKSPFNPRKKQFIETCFYTSLIHWEKVKKLVALEGFETEAEEIHFFKTVKHRFTSEMEYYSLLYFTLMFEPPRGSEPHMLFWEKESVRLDQLKENHEDLFTYHQSGKTDCDHQFFLRKNADKSLMEQFKMKEDERCFSTGYDHFFTMLIALERYSLFVAETRKKYQL